VGDARKTGGLGDNEKRIRTRNETSQACKGRRSRMTCIRVRMVGWGLVIIDGGGVGLGFFFEWPSTRQEAKISSGRSTARHTCTVILQSWQHVQTDASLVAHARPPESRHKDATKGSACGVDAFRSSHKAWWPCPSHVDQAALGRTRHAQDRVSHLRLDQGIKW